MLLNWLKQSNRFKQVAEPSEFPGSVTTRFFPMLRRIGVLCCAFPVLFFLVAELKADEKSSAVQQRTATIICPWAPGGGTDRVARFWADALQKEYGKPFVVVNRTGGAGAIGHFAGAHAKPDGNTLTLITFELSTMHRMKISRLTFRDYECVLQMNADPAAIIVQNDAPWKTVQEFVDAARAKPGQLKMSGTATGGAWDLARIGMQRAADLPVDAITWVPHQGSAPSLVELLGGHLDAVCCSIPEAIAQVTSGKLRVLAVMSEERMGDYPDIPTVKEQGIDWAAVAWRGLALPKGTPASVMDGLTDVCLKIANSDEFRAFMAKNGYVLKIRGPEEFAEFLAQQDEQWNEVVQFAGYQKGLTGNNDPGPLALPMLLVAGLAAGGAIEFFRSRHRATTELKDDSATGLAAAPASTLAETESLASGGSSPVAVSQFGWLILAMIVYVGAMPWTGFAISTFIFVTLLVRRFGGSLAGGALSAAIIILIIWLLFVKAFLIQLPAGVLGLPF